MEGPLDTFQARQVRREKVAILRRKEAEEKEKREQKSVPKGEKRGVAVKEKKRRHQMSEEEKQRWNTSYGNGYEEMQRRRVVFDGPVGPLDVDQPRMKRLLLVFLAKAGAEVDWETVGKKWRSEFPELSLARLVEKLQRGGQAR